MNNKLSYKIAEIELIIKSNSSVQLIVKGQNYLNFLKSKNENADVEIQTYFDRARTVESLIPLFSSDQAWSMYSDNNNYYLIQNPFKWKNPLLMARFNLSFSDVAIFYHKSLLNKGNRRLNLFDPLRYPVDQILLMYILSRINGAIFHAAGINYAGKGYLFPGKSGAGKSTITRQFANHKRANLLSDDRIIVRKSDGEFTSYGTPWPGEEGVAINASVPLAGIFFINHGATNRIKKITPKEALERLFPVTSIPWYDREVMPRILKFCENLVTSVPVYEFDFFPSIETVTFFEKFVSK